MAPPASVGPAPATEPPTVVKLRLDGDKVYVPVTVNGVQTEFILDTGSAESYVWATRAGDFDVADRGENRRPEIERFAIGSAPAIDAPIRVAHFAFPVEDEPEIRSGRVGGLLGLDVLRHWIVGLDLRRSEMDLWSTALPLADVARRWFGARDFAMAGLNGDGPYRATVELNGQAVDAIFDTGAEFSGIDADAARQIGGLRAVGEAEMSYPDLGDRKGALFGGGRFKVQQAEFSHPTYLGETEGLHRALGADAIIGVPDLKGLKLLWDFQGLSLAIGPGRD